MPIKVFPTKKKAQEVCDAINRRARKYHYHIQELSKGGWVVLKDGSTAVYTGR